MELVSSKDELFCTLMRRNKDVRAKERLAPKIVVGVVLTGESDTLDNREKQPRPRSFK